MPEDSYLIVVRATTLVNNSHANDGVAVCFDIGFPVQDYRLTVIWVGAVLERPDGINV